MKQTGRQSQHDDHNEGQEGRKGRLQQMEVVIEDTKVSARERANDTTKTEIMGTHPVFDPNHLLDFLTKRLGLKNDAALARLLGTTAPVISKIRHNRLPIGATLLIAMHEETGLSIRELRNVMGDRRQKYRISTVHFKPKGAVAQDSEPDGDAGE